MRRGTVVLLVATCAGAPLGACNAVLGIDGDITVADAGSSDGATDDVIGFASSNGSSSSSGSSSSTSSSSSSSSGASTSSSSSSSGSASSSSSSGTGSSGASSSGSSSGAASSSSSSSSSGSSGSSSSSSSSGSSSGTGDGGVGPIPTTCQQANGEIGCCSGNTLYYCPTTLTSQDCASTAQVCGWNSGGYYGCVAPPGGADPSGSEPIDCK